MSNKDGKGPKGQGPKDGRGGGKGKVTSKPAGSKKGGEKRADANRRQSLQATLPAPTIFVAVLILSSGGQRA